jgi:hypothetical protein
VRSPAPGAIPVSPSPAPSNCHGNGHVPDRGSEPRRRADRKACPRAYKKLDGGSPPFGQAAAQKLFVNARRCSAQFRIRGNHMSLRDAAICTDQGNHAVRSFDREMTIKGRICGRHPKYITAVHSLSAAYPQVYPQADYAGFASPREPLAAHKPTGPACQPPA